MNKEVINMNEEVKQKEIKLYCDILTKSLSDNFIDESFVTYLMHQKKEILFDFNFVIKNKEIIIKTDFWGKLKYMVNNSEGGEDKKICLSKLERLAKILNKDVNEKAFYEYLKIRPTNNEKIRKNNYKPLFFGVNIINKKMLMVSESFLEITENNRLENKLSNFSPAELTDTEMKLMVNELLYDNNVWAYELMEYESHTILIERIKEFLITHYPELDKLSQEVENTKFIKLLEKQQELINLGFQSIQGEELKEFSKTNNIERDYIDYIRSKTTGRDFVSNAIETYKDKEFWLKELNCYSKEENTFSLKNAISFFIEIEKKLEEYCEPSVSPGNLFSQNMHQFANYVGNYGSSTNGAIRVLMFFKDELKNSSNYRNEMEKLMVFSIIAQNEDLYRGVREIMKKDNGDYEELMFESEGYKHACIHMGTTNQANKNISEPFAERMRILEREDVLQKLNDKLSKTLMENGEKRTVSKI